MRRIALFMCLVVTMSLITAGCTKKETAPPKPPVPSLIDVVHDAVKAAATGDKSYKAPEGITINARQLFRDEGDRKVEYIEVSGMKQQKDSLSVIVFRVPVTWYTNEKGKLTELDTEKNTLKACAEKLQATADGRKPAPSGADPCRVLGITANGKKGIAVVDDKVRHIEMLTYSLR
jgi:hypothetical protein